MKYPKQSLLISFFIWFTIFLIGGFFMKKKSPMIVLPSLDIDAGMLSESPVHSENKEPSTSVKRMAKQKESKDLSEPSINKQEPKIINRPLPEIPEELRYEAYHSYAIARFYIKKDGSVSAALIQPTSNPKLNYLLLNSLKKWQFEMSDKESIQDIRVDFRVE
jgi:protein TonB